MKRQRETHSLADAGRTGSRAKARILIVEDHPLTRRGLMQLLDQQADMTCCGEADNISAAKAAVATLKPDLVLLDLLLGTGNGLDLLKAWKAILPDMPVLVLSQYDEALYAERALRAGARG